MGQAVIRALEPVSNAELSFALTAPTSPYLAHDASELAGLKGSGVALTASTKTALKTCDVLIDFSTPKATLDTAIAMHDTYCQTLVTGTTGYTQSEEDALLKAAENITLLRSGNFSLGVNLLEALVEKAATALGTDWDIDVLEMHHRHKIDSPSGTAFMLGEAAARGRDVKLSDVSQFTRIGRDSQRKEGEIGFAVLRGGGVVGDHEVRIANELEMLTLSHRAFDRSVFAEGAVAAALWAADMPKGLYTLRDMLGV